MASPSRSASTRGSTRRGGVKRCEVEDSDSISEGVGVVVEAGEIDVDGREEEDCEGAMEDIEGAIERSVEDVDRTDMAGAAEIPDCKSKLLRIMFLMFNVVVQ